MTQFISKINENTAIPLKILVPVMIALMTATWSISERISGVKDQLSGISSKMENSWSVAEMELWAERMKSTNPALRVPDVRGVHEMPRRVSGGQNGWVAGTP